MINTGYKSGYNLIILDECVKSELGTFLKNRLKNNTKLQGIKITLICVYNNEIMKGMKDKDLTDFCYDYNGVLVTGDKRCFKKYYGYKVFYEKDKNWSKIYQSICKSLEDNNNF